MKTNFKNSLKNKIYFIFFVTLLTGCSPENPSDLDKFSSYAGFGIRDPELGNHTLSLTFDDGPGPRTEELARYLHSEGIEATFFVTGENASNREGALRTIRELGHVVANHTWSHRSMPSTHDPILQVRSTHRIIAPWLTDGMHLFRAPYGAWNRTVARRLNQTDLKRYVGPVFWDIGGQITGSYAADWDCWGRGWSTQRCANGYFNETVTRKKGIVLLHDQHSKTVDMIKLLVPRWKRANYRFVRIDAIPSIRRALEDTADYNPDADIPPRCFEPSPLVFKKAGARMIHGGEGQYQASLSVDDHSPRKSYQGITTTEKFFVRHSETDISNMAFNFSPDAETITGIRYNISWDGELMIPFTAHWSCNRYEGSFGDDEESLILIPR